MAPADWGRSTAPATPGSNRSVAIKVLPPAFAGDAERVARFTREAQVLAALNHPNITALYGIEDSALVMEFVGGEDLSALIARGPLPLEEVRAIARQLADALDAAHQQGIVHRDLKPANIKVRADGTVKVLDFGLARAAEPGADSATGAMNSPTITARTQLGMIIGTAAYMSPEQARGKAVDRRADIWAFGYPRARAASLQLTGESIALADQPTLIFDPAMSYTGGRVASASNGGALAYVSAQPSRIAATWFDMTGRTTPAVALLDGQYSAIRISPGRDEGCRGALRVAKRGVDLAGRPGSRRDRPALDRAWA